MKEKEKSYNALNLEEMRKQGITPLHIAVAEGDVNKVQELLEKGELPNSRLKKVKQNELFWKFRGALTPYDIAHKQDNNEMKNVLIFYHAHGALSDEKIKSVIDLLADKHDAETELAKEILTEVFERMQD